MSENADFTPFNPPPEPAKPLPKAPEAPKMSPELRRLLNISALRSEFMLIALTCNKQKEYDSFMTKFRPILQQDYQSLQIDFKKLYGGKGEMRLDQYMTDLADAASLKAAREGGNFCKTHESMFHEAEYFQTAEDLAAYAEGKNLAVPLPKSPTGRRDASPVTSPEAESFANFAHPSFTPRKPPSQQNPKPTNFVPIKKSSTLPPLEEPKPSPPPAAKDSAKENDTSSIQFPAPSAETVQAPQQPLPAPQPYPDFSVHP
ncbi:hypothetical protein RF55_12460 [Lasius niger]|uniref:Uncharacterized protein n=1 Tax=Lasius niger TaxID=67767 RepID=A0A0J7KD32_LASNI|nr:hypothetical protein RF55_12460 [Lasius niger]